ncbi:MAG TPA: ATP-binding protein, partial [Rhodothermales bacterium]|nr:ATP-binding protein [Rhodothermales bacterium]
DGLPSNNIRDLYEDAEGYLWIALEDQGLCRLSPGFTEGLHTADLGCLTTRDGLYHNGLHRILEDHQGRFWFNTNNGIFWVERSALMARLAGEIPAVASVSYTEAEGMRNREGNGGTQPAGIKASDGRLWFPTQGGVVIIDPDEITSPAPPPVVLEAVQVGDEARQILAQSMEPLALAAGERDLAIHYTAQEFTRPRDVRFQVRLAGYDDVWHDVGERREAQYTNLPPGHYRFEVRAGLGGVWGEAATLALHRPPLLWETAWFYVLLGVMAVMVVGAFIGYRTRRHQAREATLERVVAERTEELARQAEALHETNAALHKANEVKSRFLANISHEFRTPLTLTFGPISDLVEGRFDGLEEARPHFERARRNGHRLLRLINQLLELSRLDAGMLQLQVERQDLALFLRHIAALFEDLAYQRHLLFTRYLPEHAFWHVFDADKLEKIVVNLLSNAFKFTPPHGKVSLSLTQAEDGGARIEVADTGPGIAAGHLPRLFDRFYQIEQAATRAHEGSGIGLSLAKELVDLHEGRIEVESAVGFGSRFIVLLPPLKETPTAARGDRHKAGVQPVVTGEQYALSPVIQDGLAQESPPEASGEENEVVVLVVEDNADMRAYIRAHLASDYRVVEAAHGKVGVTLAQDWVPDLVLSDVMMPEMDGLELCAALKADVRTSHIPVVLLTAKADVENRIAGFESGADAYLPKPFDAEELRVRVRTLIEERQRLRDLFGEAEEATSSAEQAAPVLPAKEVAFLAQVEETIAANLSDADFGVGQLAEAVHMSRRQLLRKLRALTTESPSELLRRMRLEKASVLLQEGGSAKEVAYAVGFKSYPSFSHAFNSVYGMPPSAYAQED